MACMLEKCRKGPREPRSFWILSLSCLLLFLGKLPNCFWWRKAFWYHWHSCNSFLWTPILAVTVSSCCCCVLTDLFTPHICSCLVLLSVVLISWLITALYSCWKSLADGLCDIKAFDSEWKGMLVESYGRNGVLYLHGSWEIHPTPDSHRLRSSLWTYVELIWTWYCYLYFSKSLEPLMEIWLFHKVWR